MAHGGSMGTRRTTTSYNPIHSHRHRHPVGGHQHVQDPIDPSSGTGLRPVTVTPNLGDPSSGYCECECVTPAGSYIHAPFPATSLACSWSTSGGLGVDYQCQTKCTNFCSAQGYYYSFSTCNTTYVSAVGPRGGNRNVQVTNPNMGMTTYRRGGSTRRGSKGRFAGRSQRNNRGNRY